MIIDAHVHLLPRKVQRDRTPFCKSDQPFGSIYSTEKARIVSEDEIIAYMDDSGINRAIVFGFPWEDRDLVKENNDEIWSFHQSHAERIIPFAVLSSDLGEPTYKEAERTLEGGFSGLGELSVYHRGWSRIDLDALYPIIRLAAMKTVPVLIHVNEPVGHNYPGKIPVDFSGLLQVISDNPDVDFILAHFGGGVFIYSLMPEIRSALARTYIDTAASPFLYDAKIYDVACSIMGSDKILFGSDFPLLPLVRYLKDFDKAGIHGNVREGILGGNVNRLLAGKFQ